MSLRQLVILIFGICILPVLLSSCNQASPLPTATEEPLKNTATATITPQPSATPLPPTATPVPLAAIVNGEGIRLDEFQAEVTRYQESTTITGTNLATDTNTVVMDELIDQTLLAQAAAENGYSVDESLLQSRITALESKLGGDQALIDWQAENGYNDESFKLALKRSIAATWMQNQLIAAVPETADEVHVLQILVPTQAEADEVYSSLQSGKDFLEVASIFDPLTQGDLGWFPRGYLKQPAIEEAAFGLQAGQYSQVIKTDIGYHILYLLERDPEHQLQPDARRVLQVNAVQDWLSERRTQSEIQLFLP